MYVTSQNTVREEKEFVIFRAFLFLIFRAKCSKDVQIFEFLLFFCSYCTEKGSKILWIVNIQLQVFLQAIWNPCSCEGIAYQTQVNLAEIECSAGKAQVLGTLFFLSACKLQDHFPLACAVSVLYIGMEQLQAGFLLVAYPIE